jgi:dipeptidyl aminopeptidase/acylaminoacyl peptidase
MLAFQAIVDGQTQVAVMRPKSGNWTILSHEKTKGAVEEMSWSRDGTRIFFSRTADVPRGIYSIPSLGGEERLVLEDAATPQALGDGSLLVVRLNAEHRGFQLFHFWPQTGRLDPLDALVEGNGFTGGVARVFPDGREAVFLGQTLTVPAQKALYAVDLTSNRTRRLAPNLPIAELPSTTSLATTPDGQWVLLNIRSGNVDRIVEVPRNGSNVIRPLLILSASTGGLDVGTDGSIYVAQRQRFAEALSYWPSTGKVEHLALPDTAYNEFASMILPLPDGRLLFDSSASGRLQLSVIGPGKEAVPFLETEEPTSGPLALLGKNQVAFLIGTPPKRQIGVASLTDGRIVHRLEKPNAGSVEALAGSPDGKTLYYAEAGVVWATPSDGGESRRFHEGNRIAIDSLDESVIIESFTNDGVKLVRLAQAGGAEKAIPMPSGLKLLHDFSSGAVASDGRIAVQLAPKDSWFWPAAILDPRSGKITQLPVLREFDMPYPAWGPDGRLVSLALPFRSALWRFSPVAGEQR